MKKQHLAAAMLGSLILAIGLPLATAGTFVYVAFAMLCVLLSLALLAGGGGVFLWARWKGSETLHRKAGTMLSVALVGMTQWAAIPVVNHLSEKQLATARGYCESLIPEIERFRQKHGRCPERVDEIAAAPAPDFLGHQPLLWASNGAAAGEACEFGFQFRLPGSPPLVVHRYTSSTGEWTMED